MEMKKTGLSLALAGALLCMLCACGSAAEGPAPTDTTPVETGLLDLLAGLTEEDIGDVSQYGPNEPPDRTTLAALLNEAAAHPIDHADLTINGSDTDVVWSLDCYIAPKNQGICSGADALHLQAGLEENVVEIFGGENLPDGRVHLEDAALYQLLRTSCDQEGFINEYYYEKYRDLVDGYYNGRLEEVRDAGYTAWEFTEFLGVLGTTKESGKGAVAFRMGAAFVTDPPELAPHVLAGGAYVDSALRVHGLDWQNVYLVTLDEEPVGLSFGEGVIGFIRDHSGEEVHMEDLQAAMNPSSAG